MRGNLIIPLLSLRNVIKSTRVESMSVVSCFTDSFLYLVDLYIKMNLFYFSTGSHINMEEDIIFLPVLD
jgi:hypothetical protein